MNVGRVLLVVGLLGLAVPAVLMARNYQLRQMSRAALAAAQTLRDQGEADLAVRHLNQHLETHPADADALELKSRILAETAENHVQTIEAARVHDQFLRAARGDRRGPTAQRRLVRLYVKYGDMLRTMATSSLAEQLVVLESRYRSAETVARHLLSQGANDADAHLLLAEALDGLAVPGDVKAQQEAVQEYRKVLSLPSLTPEAAARLAGLSPEGPLFRGVLDTNVEAAARLATLYTGRLKDPVRAEQVLDELLQAVPRSVDVRRVRHQFYIGLIGDETYRKLRGNPEPRAAAELAEAIRIAPEDLDVIVDAAQFALRRGDTEEARRYLAQVPEDRRGGLRVLLTSGLVEYGEEKLDEAVDAWRRGLANSAGTNEEMTWWLAYALVQMERVAEAVPLFNQYRRLTYDDTPKLRLLAALLDERNGRPGRAIVILDQIHQRLDPRYEGMVELARGRCFEALGDESKARSAYRRALDADPAAVVPRLSIARIELRRSPEEAIEIIGVGLGYTPDEPALRLGMAGALLRKEARKPAGTRDWSAFENAWKRAGELSPGSSELALLRADQLNVDGRPEDAIAHLEKVAAASPRGTTVAVALAEMLERRGRHQRALEVIERALAAAGDQATLRIRRARALTSLDRGREARDALYKDIDALKPSDRVTVWIALGKLELDRGKVEEARTAFTYWSGLVPADPRPHLALLELAIDQRDETAARAQVAELRKMSTPPDQAENPSYEPVDTAYRLARAMLLVHENDKVTPIVRDSAEVRQAQRLVELVLDEAPELPAARMLRAQVLHRTSKDRWSEAVAAYEEAWARGVESALPPLYQLLSQLGRYDDLLRLRAAATRHRAVSLDLLAAQAFVRIGDRARAAKISEQLARDLPAATSVAEWQARMLGHLGRTEDAESVLRALAERQPGAPDPWVELVQLQARWKRTAAIAETIERAKAAVKSDPPELFDARLRWAAGDLPAARKGFAACVEKKPTDPVVLVEVAWFLEKDGQPARAAELLERVLARDPKHAEARRQLGVVRAALARASGDLTAWKQALEVLDRPGPNAPPASPDDRLARAVVVSRCPDPARAREAVGQLEALCDDLPVGHPVAIKAREMLARLYEQSGATDKAANLAAVSASVAADPEAIALYAQTLIQTRKPEAASWQLDRLAAARPGDAREARLRAQIYFDRSRPVESAAALESAYANRRDAPGAEALGREAFRLLADIRDEQDPAVPSPVTTPALERLGRRLAERNPACSWMPALALVRNGQYPAALELLRKAAKAPGAGIEDLRESCRVAMRITVATLDAETLTQVDAVLSAALAAEPNADEVLLMQAMLRHLQANFEEEVRIYRLLLEHRPESYVVLNNLAWALSEGLDRASEAEPLTDRLVKLAGARDPQALDTRGMVRSRLGRHDEALRDLEQVVRAEPTPTHYFHLARAYHRAGRLDDARRGFDLALRANLTPRDVDPAERADFATLQGLRDGR